MDTDNEARPLLHSFERDSWRTRVRKRCMRFPSELTVTGIVLGLFLVVVTLLIVFEKVETDKKDDITLDTKLLASPFKFNKKVEDKSWQDKKDNMKKKQNEQNQKWDNVNKGWKKIPDIPGWKDKAIREALFKALKEKKEEMKESEAVLQSSMNFDNFINKISDSFKENIPDGSNNVDYMKKGSKQVERQKTINDEWKDKMNILQSPKSSFKKIVKDDPGWKKLADQGWKNKEIEEALIKAWMERDVDKNVSQSPMNIQSLWGKATDFLRNLVQKGTEKQNSDIVESDQLAYELDNILQSPKSSYEKWKKIDEIRKKHSKDGTDKQKSEKEINDEWAKEIENLLQSPRMSYDKWKEVGEFRKKHSKDDWKDKDAVKAQNENYQPLQSPSNFEDFLENIVEIIKDHQKGNKEAEKQKGINDEWKQGVEALYSSNSNKNDKKWKQVDDHWKKLIEHERNSFFGKNDGDGTPNIKEDSLQQSMALDNIKWDKVDDGWKKLSDQGWKDKDIKEAVYNAWKEGDKLLQSTGYNNMKWKKVNFGWKKISNKS